MISSQCVDNMYPFLYFSILMQFLIFMALPIFYNCLIWKTNEFRTRQANLVFDFEGIFSRQQCVYINNNEIDSYSFYSVQ